MVLKTKTKLVSVFLILSYLVSLGMGIFNLFSAAWTTGVVVFLGIKILWFNFEATSNGYSVGLWKMCNGGYCAEANINQLAEGFMFTAFSLAFVGFCGIVAVLIGISNGNSVVGTRNVSTATFGLFLLSGVLNAAGQAAWTVKICDEEYYPWKSGGCKMNSFTAKYYAGFVSTTCLFLCTAGSYKLRKMI